MFDILKFRKLLHLLGVLNHLLTCSPFQNSYLFEFPKNIEQSFSIITYYSCARHANQRNFDLYYNCVLIVIKESIVQPEASHSSKLFEH